MVFFLGASADWIERFRLYWYPRLHPYLERFGGYGVGTVGYNQYVGHVDEDEEVIEEELVSAGFQRNPIACLKSLPDGRVSEGSWAIRSRTDPTGEINRGMQVHVTFFERDDGEPGREVYAHYEDDWRASPSRHLREVNFDAERGAALAIELIDEYTFLSRIPK